MAVSTMEIGVAGVTFEGRQQLLMDLYYKGQERGIPLAGKLERERTNRYDANAIKVLVANPTGKAAWQHVGYVPRPLAAKLAPRMDAGETPRVTGVRIIKGAHEHRITYGARVVVEMRPREAVQTQVFAGERL